MVGELKQILLNSFNYSIKEYKGLVCILLILFIIVLTKLLFSLSIAEIILEERISPLVDTSNCLAQANQKDTVEAEMQADHVVVKPFDPNKVSVRELKSFGFSDYAAKNLVKYRNKGGTFYVPEDILKIYGVDSVLYKTLEKYVYIEQTNKKEWKRKENIEKIKIELNRADSSDLIKLRGIGKVFSARIVKYRELLGGFHSISQLKEVYGINPEVVENNMKYLYVDTAHIEHLLINTADKYSLRKHPYVSYELAEGIVKSRSENGRFDSFQDFLTRKIIPEEDFNKLRPYLKFDE